MRPWPATLARPADSRSFTLEAKAEQPCCDLSRSSAIIRSDLRAVRSCTRAPFKVVIGKPDDADLPMPPHSGSMTCNVSRVVVRELLLAGDFP